MSETDKAAIEIVRNLTKNMRSWAIAMVGIFAIAILGAVFWGGTTDNQLDTNTENIRELTKTVNDFIIKQSEVNGKKATDQQVTNLTEALSKSSQNWSHLSWWAETKGYRPLPRGIEQNDSNRNY